MRATLDDGATLTGPFPSMTTGYRAETIEIGPRDVRAMINILDQNPDDLRRHLLQLEARFPTAEEQDMKLRKLTISYT